MARFRIELEDSVKVKRRKKIKGNKKWQATHITPLRPSTLAAFPPWGSSTGAGCVGLASAKI